MNICRKAWRMKMAKNKKYDLVAQNTESIDNPDD